MWVTEGRLSVAQVGFPQTERKAMIRIILFLLVVGGVFLWLFLWARKSPWVNRTEEYLRKPYVDPEEANEHNNEPKE